MTEATIKIMPGHKVSFRMGHGTRKGIVLAVKGTSATVREYHDNGIYRTHTLSIAQLFNPQ